MRREAASRVPKHTITTSDIPSEFFYSIFALQMVWFVTSVPMQPTIYLTTDPKYSIIEHG